MSDIGYIATGDVDILVKIVVRIDGAECKRGRARINGSEEFTRYRDRISISYTATGLEKAVGTGRKAIISIERKYVALTFEIQAFLRASSRILSAARIYVFSEEVEPGEKNKPVDPPRIALDRG